MNSPNDFFGENFVQNIYKMFERAETEGKFVFMHGTLTYDQAENMVLHGLTCDYPELYYTADLMNIEDPLLFDKLRSWPHWDLKYLLALLIPKNAGKGGIPIWNKDGNDGFCLSPKYIYGIIDVKKKSILLNPEYSQDNQDLNGTVEDRSFETGTGKCIEVSLSPIEEEMYEDAFRANQIDTK